MPLRLFLLPYSREWSYHKHTIQITCFALRHAEHVDDGNAGYVGDEDVGVEHAGAGNVGVRMLGMLMTEMLGMLVTDMPGMLMMNVSNMIMCMLVMGILVLTMLFACCAYWRWTST